MSLGHEHGLVLIGLAGPMDVVNLSLSLSSLSLSLSLNHCRVNGRDEYLTHDANDEVLGLL